MSIAASQKGINVQPLRKYIKEENPNWNFFDELTDAQKAIIPDLEKKIKEANKNTFTI